MSIDLSLRSGRVGARLARQVEVGLSQIDLTLSQYRTLMFLDEGWAAASVLADHLAVTRPSVTAVVDGLVARGLVERKPHESDRRRIEHRLTEQGRQVLCQADRAVEARLREIAGHLANEEEAGGRLCRPGSVAGRSGRLPGGQAGNEMSLATRIAAGRRVPDAVESGSPWVPVAEEAQYEAPKATIDPDPTKSWIRRALPVVMSHKFLFITALTTSFISLVLQVQIPKILQEALDNSIVPASSGQPGVHAVPLSHYVEIILVLVVAAAMAGYVSRLFLMTTAYKMEFDLRNIMYQHLTRMSFPFYDRVQSGQLISRSNSDIRSVQMYLTFAPSILVQCAIAIVAFGYMLSINVPLALVAMSTMPFIYFLGVRMRRSMFPVSWLIQARLADVATIVDENINGVRVVKSFAAEDQQLKQLAKAADRLQWAYVKDADLRARFTPLVQNLVQVGLALVLLLRRVPGDPRQPAGRGHPELQLLDRHAAAALPDARDADHAGPAGPGVGRADLRDPGRAADDRRSAGRRRPGRYRSATSASTT